MQRYISLLSSDRPRKVIFGVVFFSIALGRIGLGLSAIAAPAEKFPSNPLLVPKDAPAVPAIPKDKLRGDIARLNEQAAGQLQAGDRDKAFELWNQALQLSRGLGPEAEVRALAQVGLTAWEGNETRQVRYVSQRLQQIQTENTPGSQNLRTELATAYQGIRAPELALKVYDTNLKEARQKRDALAEFQNMNAIGLTHLDWFGYTRAAKTYQELLDQAKAANDVPNQMAYAYQLAYIHEQKKQPKETIAALETLIPLYAPTPEPLLLANLQIRLAKQYQANDQATEAENTYQAAYRSAEVLLQPGYKGDALRLLGSFYRQQKRYDAAAQVYDFLSTFEQNDTQNYYNAMDAYDRLGQTWLDQQDIPKATIAFQQGLQIAQVLNYRTSYFSDRLAKLQSPPQPAQP
jgi:tetratricopeptide (TPR) repeat protein